MNNEDRLDLSLLDPEGDPDRLDRVVDDVLQRLGPGIVSSSPGLRHGVVHVLAQRFRPLVAAASLVALLAAIALITQAPPESADEAGQAVVALSAEVEAWFGGGPAPSAEDLLFMFAGNGQ